MRRHDLIAVTIQSCIIAVYRQLRERERAGEFIYTIQTIIQPRNMYSLSIL